MQGELWYRVCNSRVELKGNWNVLAVLVTTLSGRGLCT